MNSGGVQYQVYRVLIYIVFFIGLTGCLHNEVPVSDAGESQSVSVGDKVLLDGSNSYDIDGAIVEFKWSLIQSPVGSNAFLSESDVVDPTFVADVAGAYVIGLVVFDGELYSEKDFVIVTAVVDEEVDVGDQVPPKPDPEPVPDPQPESMFPEGLELTISGIDMTYQTGDVIKLSATLTNNSAIDVEYYKMTSSSIGVTVEIQTASGSHFTLRNPSDPDFDLQVVTKVILLPGESITRKVEWDQSIPGEKMAAPGEYQVNAYAFVTQLSGETSGEFSSMGTITIESLVVMITEVDAILSGLKDAMVNQWYLKNNQSILCSTESVGLVLINDYVATPIQTLVAVPDSEINCSAKLLVTANQWRIKYRSTTPSENDRFLIAVDATTGAIIPKFDLVEMK